jgi:hypothetical protein
MTAGWALTDELIIVSIASTSGDCILDAGSEIGSSGRSSRNRDMVRFGTPALTCRGIGLMGGVGVGVVCIESRDVLEKEDGPPELRLALFAHLKMDDQDRGPLPVPFDGFSDCSVLVSESRGDFDRENFLRSEPLDVTLV